jgi:spoIIIJ-associated protein
MVLAENSEIAELAKGILERLLEVMGVAATVELKGESTAEGVKQTAVPVAFDIKGEDLGILIGRRGQTLSCLQFVVRLIVAHQIKTWVPITIDVEGYRERRDKAVQTLAWRVAEQVRANGKQFTLEPMPSFERRIVHMTLADHPDVTTQSIGTGEARRVVVSPKKK